MVFSRHLNNIKMAAVDDIKYISFNHATDEEAQKNISNNLNSVTERLLCIGSLHILKSNTEDKTVCD